MRRNRNYKLFIADIKESLDKIEEYIENISEEQFRKDTKLQDAVIRRLEIIGESIKNIPKSVRDTNKSISWEALSRFKNLLIHSYFEVSLNRIWIIIKEDLPKIKVKIKAIKLL